MGSPARGRECRGKEELQALGFSMSPSHCTVSCSRIKNQGSSMGSSNPTLPCPSHVTVDTLHELSSKSVSVLSCKMGLLRGLSKYFEQRYFVQGLGQSKKAPQKMPDSLVSPGAALLEVHQQGWREAYATAHLTARMSEAQGWRATMM